MSTGWTFKVVLPAGGAQVEVDQALAVVEPMGDNGVRIKWPAETRREVRLSVEQVPIEGAFGQVPSSSAQPSRTMK